MNNDERKLKLFNYICNFLEQDIDIIRDCLWYKYTEEEIMQIINKIKQLYNSSLADKK